MPENKTTAFFAAEWNIKARRVALLCEQGRIPGAEKVGRDWIIPADAVKPADARIKSGDYIGVFARRKKQAKGKDGADE